MERREMSEFKSLQLKIPNFKNLIKIFAYAGDCEFFYHQSFSIRVVMI